MEEIWKDIPEFENIYQVSNFGRVKGLERSVVRRVGYAPFIQKEYILKGTDSKIYFQPPLYKDGVYKYPCIHKLVALLFIENPKKLRCVNHKDGDRHNNHHNNLEWVSHRENSCHSLGLKAKRKSKYTGVTFRSDNGKWDARIFLNGKGIRLGSFFNERAAALTYFKFLIDNGIKNKYVI